jgi:hypothetical protein
VLCGKLAKGDLSNKAFLNDAISEFMPDAVMHFAALIQVEESVRGPLKYFRNTTPNTRGVKYIVGKENPLTVHPEIIEAIKERMEGDIVIQAPEDIAKGERILVREGNHIITKISCSKINRWIFWTYWIYRNCQCFIVYLFEEADKFLVSAACHAVTYDFPIEHAQSRKQCGYAVAFIIMGLRPAPSFFHR